MGPQLDLLTFPRLNTEGEVTPHYLQDQRKIQMKEESF